MTAHFVADVSLLRPPSAFHCGETMEENGEVGSVAFYSTLPSDGKRLVFSCREPSCGVLVADEPKAEQEEDGAVDPFFFDEGYTLAGRTGFQIWAASRLVIEALVWPFDSDGSKLTEWQRRIATGAKVLELGSGIGVVGANLAAAGAQVLLTDLPTLVTNATLPNLKRNKIQENASNDCPSWLQQANAVQIGRGWAGAKPLDWTLPIHEQLSDDQFTGVDFIVSSDCVWLVKMLDSLLDTVAAIFDASKARSPKLLMGFQRRDGNDSSMFTTVDRVLASVKSHGWRIECLAWHPVTFGNDEPPKEVFIFEISPGTSLVIV